MSLAFNPMTDNVQTFLRTLCASVKDIHSTGDDDLMFASYCLDAPEFIPAGFTSKNKAGTTCPYVVQRDRAKA